MPCSNNYLTETEIQESRERAFLRSALCAALTTIEKLSQHHDVFSVSGIIHDNTYREDHPVSELGEIQRWWDAHKFADGLRRKREAAEKRQSRIKAKARAKVESLLSEEELRALGLLP